MLCYWDLATSTQAHLSCFVVLHCAVHAIHYGICHRDPNGLETVDQFLKSIQWVCSGDFTQQDIDEAKLAVFAQVRNLIHV